MDNVYPIDGLKFNLLSISKLCDKGNYVTFDSTNCVTREGWQKWNSVPGVLCDKRVPLGLKGKVYRMVVRPAVLYGSECWPLKKTQAQRLMVAEMRMIRWMCGFTRLDRIRNGVIRSLTEVAPIEEKMRELRLRWFGHVKRRSVVAPVWRCEMIVPPRWKEREGVE